ncbi:MAG: TolC family protein [Planctomycetota bacterium]
MKLAQLEAPLPQEKQNQLGELTSEESEAPEDVCELNLATALAMVSGQNPVVAFAAERYAEAYARLEAARVLWLPAIRAGVSYNKHEGTLQSSDGRVLDVSRGSLQSGLGVQSVGAGSPAVPGVLARFQLTDAIFQPRIANRIAAARQEAARATTHDVLLETALAYLNLLEATEQHAIAEETFTNARQLADLTATFARTGQGPQADADRARAELVVRENEVTRAEEGVRVASARLNELLSLEPTTSLLPQEPAIVPLDLVERETPLTELLSTSLANRPELAQSRHLVGEAVHRYRREKYAPLLPSALLGVSYDGFGGGEGSTVGDFRDRFDFDAVAYWEVRNLGFGEGAARDETRSRYRQARLREVQVMDRVAREVVEAHARVQARHKQIAVAESGIEAATDSYRRNLERIRAGEGLPIEALQSIQALSQARREYLRTLVDYNEAQFRLYRALGWPIQ